MKISVNLGPDSYDILIANDLLKTAETAIKAVFTGRQVFIISDDNVYPLYGERLTAQLAEHYVCHHLVLPHGEPTKSFDTLPRIYAALIAARLTRSDLIIALGGGVIGDLAGYAAATYLRGLPFIQIPTSLLAQVDSSVGGKVAVDLPQGKNLVGAFYQPRLVLIDPLVLKTLPEHFVSDGMGEVIKYGCIKDARLFATLQQAGSFAGLTPQLPEIIAACVDIKRQVVERDPFDKGERMLLNFGHTLAHAIEQFYHYERESHGEAVAIGMYQITRLAEEKGLTAPGCAAALAAVLKGYGLPLSCGLAMADLTPTMKLDKKNLNNALNVILLRDIGHSYIHPATTDFFRSDTHDTI